MIDRPEVRTPSFDHLPRYWPRMIELMLGCWLAVSPFVFGHGGAMLVVDLLAATAVVTVSLVALHPRASRAHLVTVVIGAALALSTFVPEADPPAPGHQNHMAVGVLLAMFAILPGRCAEPPPEWVEAIERGTEGTG